MQLSPFNFAQALTAGLLAAALVQAAATLDASVYRNSIAGFQTASSEGENINLLLNAEGDLPGINSISLQRDEGKVSGGSWTLTVIPPDSSPTSGEKGRLTGSVTGGTLGFNDDGALARAEALQLTVRSGTGQYAGVKSGSGTINLSPRAENPSQLTGTLTLNF